MKKNVLIVFLAIAAWSVTVNAETYSTQDGMDRIGSNVKNSKLNQKEYEKNLGTVNGNLTEITKAKTDVMQIKQDVTKEILSNNDSLKKVLLQEREINQLISQEKQKIEVEQKQLQQLEALTTQIRSNIEKRNQYIADYQNQVLVNQSEKKAWKDREAELRAQEGQVIDNLRTIASEEKNWTNKKKGYELEVRRWSAESEKQQKVLDTYQGLKEPN
jgi:chromosome segregation ATPase